MEEQQRLQESELTDDIVCASCCLLSFKTRNADTNMCCSDHIDIIGTITNWEGDLVRETLSNDMHDISLLLWWDSACQNHLDHHCDIEETLFELMVGKNWDECLTTNYEWSLPLSNRPLIVFKVFETTLNLSCDIRFFVLVDKDLYHVIIKKSWRETNVHSGFYLISSEDPDFDTRLSHIMNGLIHTFLKLVFNGSWANEVKFFFHNFIDLGNFFFPIVDWLHGCFKFVVPVKILVFSDLLFR